MYVCEPMREIITLECKHCGERSDSMAPTAQLTILQPNCNLTAEDHCVVDAATQWLAHMYSVSLATRLPVIFLSEQFVNRTAEC